jgi:hypothetical protein
MPDITWHWLSMDAGEGCLGSCREARIGERKDSLEGERCLS